MTTDATRAHIDAETLAAWAEHVLPAEVAAAVELHLSNCERCQEVLAAFARSEPAPAAVVIPFWDRRWVQWSAAGLAAAASISVIVWINTPPAVPSPVSTVAIDSMRPQSQGTPAAAPSELRRDQSAAAAVAEKPTPPQAGRSVAQASKQVEQKTEAVAAPPPPPPPVGVSAAAPVAGIGRAAAPANTQMVTMSESAMKDAARSVVEIIAPDPTAAAFRSLATDASRGAGRGGAGGARSEASQATAPARWRIVGGTRVERSTNAGRSWVAMPIKPALTARLVAGSATSQYVCWFVGAQGVVLVTTDGVVLRRVSLPEPVPLTAVVAVDGARATVTAADGRMFTTADGGLTWK